MVSLKPPSRLLNKMEILERVKTRLSGEAVEDGQLQEMIQTVSDRLCIRLGEETLPAVFMSVCIDAVIKMHRRIYYEGISTENTGSLSTAFVEDVLAEYAGEISDWKSRKANTSGSGRTVHFL